MAWFKPNEQRIPAPPDGPPPARPAASSATVPVGRPAASPASPAQAQVAVDEAGGGSNMSRISGGIMVHGEISGSEDLAIYGQMEGTVRLEGARVTISPGGRVRANVSAREIVVQGEVKGELRADERVEIAKGGSVQGSATAKRVVIEDGAVINGSIEVVRPGETTRATESSAARAGASGRGAGKPSSPAPAAQNVPETARRDGPVIARDGSS